METLHDRWERVTDEGNALHEFENIEPKLSQRSDLHAFMRLDQWFPGNSDIVSAAEHEQIYLSISEEDVNSLTDAQMVELSKCGIWLSSEYDCLTMFV